MKQKSKKPKCVICSRVLIGKQSKFCSKRCQKRGYPTSTPGSRLPKVDYIINDANFGDLPIFKTAKAWWKDERKVRKLIKGLKMDCKPRELRVLAGITQHQYNYFITVHPEFSIIFKDMRAVPSILARQSVTIQMQRDGYLAMKYLEKKEPDEFKESKEVIVKDQPILIDDVLGDDDD